MGNLVSVLIRATLMTCAVSAVAQPWTPVALESQIDGVAPMTGLVLWHSHEEVATDAIQLEFSYMLYNDVVGADGRYDWTPVDTLLDEIAARGHQAILRFRFVYPGYAETAVPDSIKKLPDYREVVADSEGKPTAFCDWSHPALQAFALEFHTRFAKRYDNDPRLAYVQVGFGLWAEYHIYDGPMKLGQTFPSKEFQATFLQHLEKIYVETPWSISIDAAEEERTPFAASPRLQKLSFGLFDDSFMHQRHDAYNETCWDFFGRDRWKKAPAGGEFSYYTRHDQQHALSDEGPHGEPFVDAARRFHISYMLANNQPGYQSMDRIRQAGQATGYRFRVNSFETNGRATRVTLSNEGVAPIYHDAFPSLGDTRSKGSLRNLLPGQSRTFTIPAGARPNGMVLSSDRLVAGQLIPFAAHLAGPPKSSDTGAVFSEDE